MGIFGGGKPGAVTPDAVLAALRGVLDPNLGQDIVTLGLVAGLTVEGGRVSFMLEFTSEQPPQARAEIHSRARKTVQALPGVTEVKAGIGTRAAARAPQGHGPHAPARPDAAPLIPDVRYTIAVSSGKGGVGKSTVAVNVALALHGEGAGVGLVDVDVYGPNVPLMIGARGRPGMVANRIVPVQAYGVKVMSIGFFVREGDPVVWRGPMIHSAVQQFLKDVEWGPLDYLLFDMPPGTGDAQLSLSQTLPLSGAIMVTTPQDVSLLDVRKGLQMFRKMNVPILGIVENMAGFACPHCHHVTAIFGEGGGARLAREFDVPVLGSIPLDPETRVGGDTGEPIVVARPESAQAAAFRAVASAMRERLREVAAPPLPVIS
ncbi:MAG TPA: Mrp/NBP35 family ATP-binding protein [Methylomirabilota bacterium]|jgi:ATP-binding protein involved in chromosome partitioning|nr:Mrp/NBP35 family ATP-binding protein [Methylomirabilota bacterium]